MKKEKKLRNAITEALREMERCPDDSIQDIFNWAFEAWDVELVMDRSYNIDRKD